MKITLLGASGQIGKPTLLRLAAAFPDAQIIGTSRSGQILNASEFPNIQSIAFNPFVDDWQQLGQADVVVNSIGQILESKEMPFKQIHLGLTKLIVSNWEQMGKPRVIQISALGAGLNPDISFLSTKAEADDLLLEQARGSVIVRPSIVCSPNTMLVQKMRILYDICRISLGKLPVPQGFPDTRIQPILVEDLTDLMVELVRKAPPAAIIPAVGPEALSFREVISQMATLNDMKVKLMEVPRGIVDSFVKFFVSSWLPHVLNYEQFQLLFRDNIASMDLIGEALGRAPQKTEAFWNQELLFKS